LCCFLFHGARQGVGIGGNGADARLQVVVKYMRAELQIETVGCQAHHGKQQDDRNHRDENVHDDEAVPQCPHEFRAEPRHQPDEQVNRREEADKADESGEANRSDERRERAHGGVQKDDHERDAVQRRYVPQKDK
jgi:hypothetical protein